MVGLFAVLGVGPLHPRKLYRPRRTERDQLLPLYTRYSGEILPPISNLESSLAQAAAYQKFLARKKADEASRAAERELRRERHPLAASSTAPAPTPAESDEALDAFMNACDYVQL